jgi:hypothetical protein
MSSEDMYIDFVKKQKIKGVFLNVMVESLNRRYPLAVPADVARLFKNKERILTIAYRKKVSLLCSNIPFRTAWNVFNELSDRKAREQSVPFQTFVDDFLS